MDTSTTHQAFSSSSSFSSCSSKPWIYDVFLSYSGEETLGSFTDLLYLALKEAGLNAFTADYEIERKEDKAAKLLQAIQGSRISVIVFSRNYAAFSWCLEELVKIMACRRTIGQLVMPIFYDVDPLDVRKQIGSYAEAFDRHEERCGLDIENLQRWRAALTEAANLSGWDLRNTADGYEGKFIRDIIDYITSKLNKTDLCVAAFPVGISSRVQDMIHYLGIGMNDVRMVGIWGMGGIGKTTIAKAIYNKFYHSFEGKSFLANVRETTKRPNGLVRLQEQLISDILETTKIKIGSLDNGINMIKETLGCRRVLVIIDDIDQEEQLNMLARNHDWFGPGSRIIMTTRDQRLLRKPKVVSIYRAQDLDVLESLELFSWHAFRDSYRSEEYYELSMNVVTYCQGLPLALVVLGCSLFGRSITEWKSKLEECYRILDGQIQEILRVSFDGLSEDEKDIFLEISCSFIGMDKNDVIEILNARGYSAEMGIIVLVQRSLLTVNERNQLMMHDLVRDMGREIAHAKYLDDPGKYSMLLHYEDVPNLLMTDKPKRGLIKSVRDIKQFSRLVKEVKKPITEFMCMRIDEGNKHVNPASTPSKNSNEISSSLYSEEPFAEHEYELLPYSSLCLEENMEPGNSVDSLRTQKKRQGKEVKQYLQTPDLISLGVESLREPLEVADSYSAATIDKDLILCQGSDLNVEQVHKRTSTPEEDSNLEEKAENRVHLEGLFLYCSLFPSGYEFRKEELVQLWIAEGFFGENQSERMEDIGSEYFNSLVVEGFLVLSRSDFRVDFDSTFSVPMDNPRNFLYKVNPIKLSVLENSISQGTYFRSVDGKLDGTSEMTQHLSLVCEDIDEMTFGVLKKFKDLHTLLVFSGCGSSIKHIPRNLFLSLKFLRTLNLSRTSISELPSSIRNVKTLRYVDVSNTLITRLPESMDSLHNLQTIKLRGCTNFVQLPKGMYKLTNLRHIDLDINRQLDSMPAHMGNLTKLQTLSAYLVGKGHGCHIGELKNLNDLGGALHISRLENVLYKEEAEEACLIDKKFLHRLDLRWSNLLLAEDTEEQEKILECLEPHSGLKELQIQNYGGLMLPSWISKPTFVDLVILTLYRCKNCMLLPSIGQLPALKFLSIIEMNEVEEINGEFFRNPVDDQASPAFPKLERLEVDIMLNLKEWKYLQIFDLPSLLQLTVNRCPELVTLPPLSRLQSLKHLEFRCCSKLMSLPRDGLPISLEYFIIIDCPVLKEQCHEEAEDWIKICRVPNIWFDHEHVSQKQSPISEVPPMSHVSSLKPEENKLFKGSTELLNSMLLKDYMAAAWQASEAAAPIWIPNSIPQTEVAVSDYGINSSAETQGTSARSKIAFREPLQFSCSVDQEEISRLERPQGSWRSTRKL